MSKGTLPKGQIRVISNFQPGLKDGAYKLALAQAISASGASIEPTDQTFVVAGPRFRLDPGDIHARFPPNGASSQFEYALPHLVLNKRLLPWERDIPGLDRSVPWLALLVFQEGELLSGPTSSKVGAVVNYATTTTVEQLVALVSPEIRCPQLSGLTKADRDSSCQVISVSSATFAAVVPTAKELPYLSHAREVDTSGKVPLDLQNAGLFSVVVANRFPSPGSASIGAKTIIHLVSLEGFGDLLGGDAPEAPTQSTVCMVSLCSWSFSCFADPKQSFSGLARHLSCDATGALRPADALVLRLPFEAIAADEAAATVGRRLADGYVALGYHAISAEDGFAWYRGPCAPVVANPIKKTAPFLSSSAAIIYDPSTGLFDHSLAAAWQLGRAAALRDRTFAATMMRLRRKLRTILSRIAVGSPIPKAEEQLGALLPHAVEAIGHAATNGAPPTSAAAITRPDIRPPMPNLRELLATSAAQDRIMAQLDEDADLDLAADWMGRLGLLMDVPFVHLVPDSRMLPPESIRFFYLDPNWVGAMLDGAMSIGLDSGQDAALQTTLWTRLDRRAAYAALDVRAKQTGQPTPPSPVGPITGFLLRSALVPGWPGLTVEGTKAGLPVPLLRLDRLSPEVLVCLFDGAPDRVTFSQPHEGLAFGIDDEGRITTREVTPPNVKPGPSVMILDPEDPSKTSSALRPGGLRVLNINTAPGFPSTTTPVVVSDLLTALAAALSMGTAALNPADFAVQMMKGPEELTFSLHPPTGARVRPSAGSV